MFKRAKVAVVIHAGWIVKRSAMLLRAPPYQSWKAAADFCVSSGVLGSREEPVIGCRPRPIRGQLGIKIARSTCKMHQRTTQDLLVPTPPAPRISIPSMGLTAAVQPSSPHIRRGALEGAVLVMNSSCCAPGHGQLLYAKPNFTICPTILRIRASPAPQQAGLSKHVSRECVAMRT